MFYLLKIRFAALITFYLGLMVFFPPLVLAQSQANTEFPQRTVRLVVPFPAGGATDVMARLVAQKLTELWTQPVVIENRAGATGAVGSVFVAKAAPDGYTILMGTGTTHAVSPATNPNIPYSLRDFAPISLVASFPNLLVVHPSLPAKTVPELISYLKQNPNRVNFSSTGNGGSVHLAAELFKQATKTDMVHIPYKGSAEALNDLMSGQVQLTFDNFSTVWPLVQTGKLRALGVASLERSPSAPDVPAIAEAGVEGFDIAISFGLYAPKATPKPVLNQLSTALQKAVLDPDLRKRLDGMGVSAVSPERARPEALRAHLKNEIDTLGGLLVKAGVKAD